MKSPISVALLFFSLACFAQENVLTTEIFVVTPPDGLKAKHNKRDLIQFGGQAESNSSYPNPFIVIEYCSRDQNSEAPCSKKAECNSDLLLKRINGFSNAELTEIRTLNNEVSTTHEIEIKVNDGYMSAALLCNKNGMAYSYIASFPKTNEAENIFREMIKSITWK